MGFPRQEYRSGLSFPSPGHLPYPGIQRLSPALAGRFFITEPPGKPTQDATSGKLPHIFVRSQDDAYLGEGGWGSVQKGHEGAFLGDVPHLLGGGRQRCSLCANLSIFSIKSSDSIIFRQVAYYLISGSTWVSTDPVSQFLRQNSLHRMYSLYVCYTSIKSQFFSNTFSTTSSISSSRDRNKHLLLYGSVARIRDIDRKCPARYHHVVATADDKLCSGVDLLW